MKIIFFILLISINIFSKTDDYYYLHSNELNKKEERLNKDTKKIFNFRKIYRLGIMSEFQTDSINLNIDYFLTEYINLELSFGRKISLGGKLFFNPQNDLSFYAGISLYDKYTFNKIPELYFPIGFQFMQNDGFTFSIDCGILLNKNYDFIGGLKIGYHF